jgi:hypothetical protein
MLYLAFMFGRGRLLVIGAAAGALAWPPTQALAAGSSGSTTPAPGQATANVRLYIPDAFFVHREAVTVPRRVFHVLGIVRPYVPGQWVTVEAFLGRRVIQKGEFRLKPSPTKSYGRFQAAVASPGSGAITVMVRHAETPQLRHFRTARSLASLPENLGFGSTGRFVQLIQQRLAALNFYIPQTGVYDQGTGLALDAYHRLLHWGTSQSLDGRTVSFLLDGFGSFRVRFPGHGRHAEGNLSLQLVALIDGAKVGAIYPISSGKPSTPTILGDFHVYSKVPGYLPDGMYDSNFFVRGFAIHGYDPAPDYPASHGCMRLPIVDAPSVFGWLGVGDWVDVYY